MTSVLRDGSKIGPAPRSLGRLRSVRVFPPHGTLHVWFTRVSLQRRKGAHPPPTSKEPPHIHGRSAEFRSLGRGEAGLTAPLIENPELCATAWGLPSGGFYLHKLGESLAAREL